MKARLAAGILLAALPASLQAGDITYLGSASISGTATDKSGLSGMVVDNAGHPSTIARNTFGSAGSAIDYTGAGNVYLMASDRGPNNGDAQYDCRVHGVRILVHPGQGTPVSAEIISTTLLTNSAGRSFTGSSTAFIGAMGYEERENLRLDPEGIRLAKDGSGAFWISDEYGPFVYKFDKDGRKIDSFSLPQKYAVSLLSGVAEAELSLNKMGRQTNRGMEGLAISPDGKTLIGIMQSALLQDHGVDEAMKRVSTYTRIITMNLQDRTTHEYVYPMDSEKLGVNEILAVNDHEFLVIERDGKEGAEARGKFIERIDLAGATDISRPFSVDGKTYDYSGTTEENGLPAAGKISGVKPVSKSLFLDLLSPAGGITGAGVPEKFEGLAWGPDFENGDKLLIVTTDNDFRADQPTYFYAYRVAARK